VFGHLSLSQIRRSGEDGRGLALAGLVSSYVVTIAAILAVVAATLLFAWAARVVRESSDPGGAGIPRYHASAPLDPTPLAPTALAPSLTVAHKPQAALVTR
jgi:peptidyl-prolyl cis-trans isomerase B (cyclophilin B)